MKERKSIKYRQDIPESFDVRVHEFFMDKLFLLRHLKPQWIKNEAKYI